MDVDVTAVPRREEGMEPFEVMTSESQERMLAIVEPEDLEEVLAICERWEVRAAVVGKVTTGGALRILDGWDGEVLAEVPATSLDTGAPLYDRERRPYEGFDEVARTGPASGPVPEPTDLAADLVSMVRSTEWVWSQYDHQLFLNTVRGPGDDATL